MLDRVTLDQLRTLIAIAETGSFSAAARRIGRGQSAVSQAVAALELALGTSLFDREGKVPQLNAAGRVILEDARQLVRGVETLKARAESIAEEVEPELSIAADAVFPSEVLRESLRSLAEVHPLLPVTLFTEGLGGPIQRLQDGTARLGLITPIPTLGADLDTEFLVSIPTVPVAAPTHPLATAPTPIERRTLETFVQLVLTDRTPISAGFSGGVVSHRIWRFADQHTRLDYLLSGFGWCNMPIHMVRDHIAAGRLVKLTLRDAGPRALPIHVAHRRGLTPGRAGRWLIEDLRGRVTRCVGAGHGLGEPGPEALIATEAAE